jgi:xylulokinase
MPDCILSIDIGTSKVRTHLIGIDDGRLLETRSYTFHWVHPSEGWSEVDVLQVWESTQKAVAEMVEISKWEYAIKGIGFSFISDSLVLVGKDHQPLRNMILSFDNRARVEARQIADEYGVEKLLEVADSPIKPEWVPPKILWLKKNQPELFHQAVYFLNLQQFILLKLGLGTLTDYTQACRKMLYDIPQKQWSESFCSYLGISVESLGGEVKSADSVAGKIRRFGSVDLGQELPVILGAHDTECGLFGLGCIPGPAPLLGDVTGTFDLIGYFEKTFVQKSAGFLLSYWGPVIESYVILLGVSVSGPTLEWYVRTFHPDEGSGIINRLFSEYPLDGTNKVLVTRGIESGDGCIRGINPNTTRGDLFKAVIECGTYPLLAGIKQAEMFKGKKFNCLRIGGAGAKNDQWPQLKADMFDMRVETVKNKEISSLGAALFAAVGMGCYPDYESAVSHMVQMARVFEPHPEITRRYQERFAEFLRQIQ